MINIKQCKTCTREFTPGVGAKGVYCSKSCQHADQGNVSKAISAQKRETLVNQYLKDPNKCSNCSGVLGFEQRQYKFCSRSCSALHNNQKRVVTEEFVNKQRERAINNPTGWAATRLGGIYRQRKSPRETITKTCPTCSNSFITPKSEPATFCSKRCRRTGGVREGSGRAKTGYYKGIYCGSTYELAFLICHLDHGHNIQRCTSSYPYQWENKEHKYYPDFEVDGTIYEIKGRMQPVDYVKISTCNAKLIRQEEMKPYILYVSNKYQVAKDKLWLLYDGKIHKDCGHCGLNFVPKSKSGVYCSQSCAMKANRKLSSKFMCT